MAEPLVLVTTSQVAHRCRTDTSTVRRWVAKGQLSPALTTPGGHYRFALADVDALFATPSTPPVLMDEPTALERTDAPLNPRRAPAQPIPA